MGKSQSVIQITQNQKQINDINLTRFIPFERDKEYFIDRKAVAEMAPCNIENIKMTESFEGNQLKRTYYFQQCQQLDQFLTNIIILRQIGKTSICDSISVQQQKHPFSVETKLLLNSDFKKLNPSQFVNNPYKLLQLLISICQLLQGTKNLMVRPTSLLVSSTRLYLTAIEYCRMRTSQILLAMIYWVHFQQFSLDRAFVPSESMSGTLTEVCLRIQHRAIEQSQYIEYFKAVQQKIVDLDMHLDSFSLNRIHKQPETNSHNPWLLAKRKHQIYFYHYEDFHNCICRLIRKKKRIETENCNIVFDPQEYEVMFGLEETKMVVKADQFQLDDYSSISDIELIFKMPFEITKPHLFLSQNKEVYFLQQTVYKFNVKKNFIEQISRKLSDSIFLVPSVVHQYFVIRLSVDILKNGIRIYRNQQYENVHFACKRQNTPFQSLRIDLKQVQFCQQVYKQIFLMFSNKNLWIIDLNVMYFFSYAPMSKLLQVSSKQKNTYAFDIYNQPFEVRFLYNHDGINARIKNNTLHIIGSVSNSLYYLQYALLSQAGALRLLKYHCLGVSIDRIISQQCFKGLKPLCQESQSFNIFKEQLNFYTTNNWIYAGSLFLQVFDFQITSVKNYYQIRVMKEKSLCNMRESIEKMAAIQRKWSRNQVLLIVRRVTVLFQHIHSKGIQHRNFNINAIFITESRDIKLAGWSEPQKIWHVSDYRDYLFVCFNLITQTTYDKITTRIIQTHKQELKQFPIFFDKITNVLKFPKTAERKTQIERNISSIKEYLSSQLIPSLFNAKGDDFVFSFQYNTPRLSSVCLSTQKISKMTAHLQNEDQQFTFKQSDKYAWDECNHILYIFTSTFSMYELKIGDKEAKEPKLQLQECEYLPKNISQSEIIFIGSKGLYSFGGIYRGKKGLIAYNKDIYKFNKNKLTWESVCVLEEEQINAITVVSRCEQYVYLFDGFNEVARKSGKMYKFDTVTNQAQLLINRGVQESTFNTKGGIKKIYHLNTELEMFIKCEINRNRCAVKIFSTLVCGFEQQFQINVFTEDENLIKNVSMSFDGCTCYFLKPYGKLTALKLQKLQNLTINTKTLYI